MTRGQLMHEAAEDGPPGGMLAVLGADEFALLAAADLDLTPANFNAPGQIVLSGPSERLGEFRRRAKAEAVRTMRVGVRGAFHSAAMDPALGAFRSALAAVRFAAPRVAIFSSTTAAPFTDVRAQLADALTKPVLWRETLAVLQRAGAGRFLEVGPG